MRPNETDIRIAPDGAVLSSAGTKGRLGIVEFDNPQNLTHLGSSLYQADAADPGQAATTTRVHQGMIERSNVSGVAEIADMIRINRSYESISQFIKRQDELRTNRHPPPRRHHGLKEGTQNMRALYIASSTGMAAQERNVEVISNNIANMRTTGYKKQRAEFQDLLYQQLRRAGSQSSDAGNIVPVGVEIGSGVRTAATLRA